MGGLQGRRGFGGLMVAGAGALALAGCAGTMTKIEGVAAGMAPRIAEAISLYGIAKGVAEAAVVAEPALAPLIAGLIAIADPLMARLQQASLAAEAAAAGAAQLEAQAKALLLQTAAAVHVLPNAAAAG